MIWYSSTSTYNRVNYRVVDLSFNSSPCSCLSSEATGQAGSQQLQSASCVPPVLQMFVTHDQPCTLYHTENRNITTINISTAKKWRWYYWTGDDRVVLFPQRAQKVSAIIAMYTWYLSPSAVASAVAASSSRSGRNTSHHSACKYVPACCCTHSLRRRVRQSVKPLPRSSCLWYFYSW